MSSKKLEKSKFYAGIPSNVTDLSTPRYKYIKTIGKGSFSVVKLAECCTTKQLVAIKIIQKENLNECEKKKLQKEISIVRRVFHPYIINFVEVLESPKNVYIVSDHVSGGELFDKIIAAGRLKENVTRHIFAQIVLGVKYLHDNKIVHRDLKAENILLDGDGVVKIVDFGLGNFFNGRELLKSSCGSPPYAAPEIFLARPYLGPEVDVWSMGVLLYFMVTGTLPFLAESDEVIRSKVLNGRFKVPFYLSLEIEAVIRAMLHQKREERITVENLMMNPWFKDTFKHLKYVNGNTLVLSQHAPSPNSSSSSLGDSAISSTMLSQMGSRPCHAPKTTPSPAIIVTMHSDHPQDDAPRRKSSNDSDDKHCNLFVTKITSPAPYECEDGTSISTSVSPAPHAVIDMSAMCSFMRANSDDVAATATRSAASTTKQNHATSNIDDSRSSGIASAVTLADPCPPRHFTEALPDLSKLISTDKLQYNHKHVDEMASACIDAAMDDLRVSSAVQSNNHPDGLSASWMPSTLLRHIRGVLAGHSRHISEPVPKKLTG